MPPIDLDAYVCVQDVETLDAWIARAYASGTIAVDTETDSLDSMQARLVGSQHGARAERGLLYPAGPWRQRHVRRKAQADRRWTSPSPG